LSGDEKSRLIEKGLEFEKINVLWDPVRGFAEKPAEMLAINPKGQVPTLVDGEIALYDSTIILEYLEERYPNPPLYPNTIAARVQCRLLEDFADTVLADAGRILRVEVFGKPDPAARDQVAIGKAHSVLHSAWSMLDKQLGDNEYLCDSFTVADIGCYVHNRLLRFIGTVPDASWQLLHNWIGRMENRPSVQIDLPEVNESFSALFVPRTVT
ncbi:MAG: glutathione S-transferase family protein, partial [Candidatus Binataceae bacterium]